MLMPMCDTRSELLMVWDEGRKWLHAEYCFILLVSLPASVGMWVGTGNTGLMSEYQLAWPVPFAARRQAGAKQQHRRHTLQVWEDPLESGVVFDSRPCGCEGLRWLGIIIYRKGFSTTSIE